MVADALLPPRYGRASLTGGRWCQRPSSGQAALGAPWRLQEVISASQSSSHLSVPALPRLFAVAGHGVAAAARRGGCAGDLAVLFAPPRAWAMRWPWPRRMNWVRRRSPAPRQPGPKSPLWPPSGRSRPSLASNGLLDLAAMANSELLFRGLAAGGEVVLSVDEEEAYARAADRMAASGTRSRTCGAGIY